MLNSNQRKRFCVITPYYKEDRHLLERCLASARAQTGAGSAFVLDHILVADGFPQDWLDAAGVRHVKLDRAHADYGNVARGMAALMAIAEKYDGITFLDADNWIDADHVETCLAAAAADPAAAYVIAQRRFARPDGSIMEAVIPADMPHAGHVDTNCYFFLPPSFHLLNYWCTIPRELSTHGDMLFFYILKSRIAAAPAITAKRTVNYLCTFEGIYLQQGEIPPAGAKPYVDWNKCNDWLNGLSDADLVLVQNMSGLMLTRSIATAAE